MKKAGIFLIVLLIVVVVAVGGIMIYAPARNWVGEKFSNLANVFKSEEKKNEERLEQVKNDDRYQELDDDNKQKVEDKFDQITNSDEYKGMSDEEKDEIVEKLIESEKLQQDVQKEQEEQETRKEELKQELGEISEELNNILTSEEELIKSEQIAQVADAINNTKNELKYIINSNSSSAEEIAEAQEKLEKVEKAEQEYVYNETSSAIKDQISSNQANDISNDMTLYKINGIYSTLGSFVVDAVFLKAETIGGVSIYSQTNAFVQFSLDSGSAAFDMSYAEIVSYINDNISIISMLNNYTEDKDASRAEEREQYFQENKYSMAKIIQAAENNNKSYSIIRSWDRVAEDGTIDIEHPTYLLRLNDEYGNVITDKLLMYNDGYQMRTIQKVCPEFWAHVEAEQAEAQNENLKNRSKFATLDANGNTISFDYSAYLAKINDQKTTVQETQRSYLFSDDLER